MNTKFIRLFILLFPLISFQHSFAQWTKKSDFVTLMTSAINQNSAFALVGKNNSWLGPFEIIKTNNRGETWEDFIKIDSATIINMQFLDDKTGFVTIKSYNKTYHILSSNDSGQTWTSIFSNDYSPDFQFISSKIGFVELKDEIIKTSDAGLTWDPIFTNDDKLIASFHFLDESTGGILLNSKDFNNGFLSLTTDGGNFWKSIELDNDADKIKISNPEEILISSGSSRLLSSNDGGESWTDLWDGSIGCLVGDMEIIRPGVYFVACTTDVFKVLNTYDHGLNWTQTIDSSYTINNKNPGLWDIEYNSGTVWVSGPLGISVFNEEGALNENPILGIKEKTNLNPYPNPAETQIYIPELTHGQTVRIYSLTGQFLGKSKSNPIILDNYPSGTYLLISTNGQIRKRFIKK